MSSDAGRPRLRIPVQQPWFAFLSRAQRIIVGLAVGAFVFLSGGVLDWLVTRQYLPRESLMLAGAAIALAAGVLVFRILTDLQRRYQSMHDRMQRIAELNHHIRNALQVIAYHNVPSQTNAPFNRSTRSFFGFSPSCALSLPRLGKMRIFRQQSSPPDAVNLRRVGKGRPAQNLLPGGHVVKR